MTEPAVAATQTRIGCIAPSRERKPAKGRITSEGMGGMRFSSSTNKPTPTAPSLSVIEKIQSVTPDRR